MLTIVFLRHGDYDQSTGHLTAKGANDIRRTVKTLKEKCDIHPDEIVTTPEPRGLESADIAVDIYSDEHIGAPKVVQELDEKYIQSEFLSPLGRLKGQTLLCVTHRDAIGGNVFGLMERMKKMQVLETDLARNLGTADAVVVQIDAENWSSAPDHGVDYKVIHPTAIM